MASKNLGRLKELSETLNDRLAMFERFLLVTDWIYIAITDPAGVGTIGYISPNVTKWLGYEAGELIGSPFAGLICEADRERTLELIRNDVDLTAFSRSSGVFVNHYMRKYGGVCRMAWQGQGADWVNKYYLGVAQPGPILETAPWPT